MASTPSPKADVLMDKPQSSPTGLLPKLYSKLTNWKTGLPLGIKEETTLQHGFNMNDFDFEEEFTAVDRVRVLFKIPLFLSTTQLTRVFTDNSRI
jgi:hypothetical protein